MSAAAAGLLVFGPGENGLLLILAAGGLMLLAAMLLGYAINLKLFGFLSLATTPPPEALEGKPKQSRRKKRST